MKINNYILLISALFVLSSCNNQEDSSSSGANDASTTEATTSTEELTTSSSSTGFENQSYLIETSKIDTDNWKNNFKAGFQFDTTDNVESLRTYLDAGHNLIESIEKSKKVHLANFIYALGIPDIGLSRAKLICKNFNNNFIRLSAQTFS